MFFKKVKKADLEAVSSRNADQERQENKMMRAWISFGVVIILLILLFFASINIGSLKVGFGSSFLVCLSNITKTWQRSMICVFHESSFQC